MKNKHQRIILFFFLALIALTACIDNELDFENIKTQKWNSIWAFPMVNSNLTLEDILNDTSGIIHENEDGLITLVYESEELISYTAGEIVEISDQDHFLNEEFILPDTLMGTTISLDIPFSFAFEFDEPGLRIDSAILKNGSFSFSISTNLNKDVALVGFLVSNIVEKSTYSPLQFSFDLGYQQGIDIIVRDTIIDLSNYILVFNDPGSMSNTIDILASVTITDDANPNLSPYYISLNSVFEDMEFEKFFGYAGHRSVNFKDTIQLDVFSANEDGFFSFGPESVGAEIDVYNSFGLPVTLDIIDFMAYNHSNNDSLEIYIFGEGNPSEIELNYPSFNQIGQEVHTGIISENSNLNEALDISPDEVLIEIEGILNPDSDSLLTNFVFDTSRVRTFIALNLELFGSISGFVISDTLDFHMDNIDEIKSLQFVVDVENGFPINVDLQLDFVDSVYNVLHSLLPPDERVMVAGATGGAPEYRVISPSQKITNIDLFEEEVMLLRDAREIIIKATLSTNDGQMVKIYSNYGLDLKMGAKIGLSL